VLNEKLAYLRENPEVCAKVEQQMCETPAATKVELGFGERSGFEHWPEPVAAEAYHGVAGQVVAMVEPHSEADPAAILAQFLVGFGNCVGPSPHAWVESTRHGVNLNCVLVGATSRGRKGTAWGQARQPLALADPQWAEERIKGGLTSGEGLINEVRDARGDDPGVKDKRLLVFESELGGLFRVMSRDGNNTSAAIRQLFDEGKAAVINKNSPISASSAHVSIVGHVTAEELSRHLDRLELANGFANRFLWVCVRRSKILPEGGRVPEAEMQAVARRVQGALDFGRRVGVLERTAPAKELWAKVYESLSAGGPGLYGAVISRAEAIVLRLSMLYAILDCSDGIFPKHLVAALALWEYCDRCARYLFGDATGDPVADPILKALKTSPDGMSRLEITKLLGQHKTSAQIERALATLERNGSARCETRKTNGRPREIWFALRRILQ
jgi:hypothetical protein